MATDQELAIALYGLKQRAMAATEPFYQVVQADMVSRYPGCVTTNVMVSTSIQYLSKDVIYVTARLANYGGNVCCTYTVDRGGSINPVFQSAMGG